jgi:hypothetical protein
VSPKAQEFQKALQKQFLAFQGGLYVLDLADRKRIGAGQKFFRSAHAVGLEVFLGKADLYPREIGLLSFDCRRKIQGD